MGWNMVRMPLSAFPTSPELSLPPVGMPRTLLLQEGIRTVQSYSLLKLPIDLSSDSTLFLSLPFLHQAWLLRLCPSIPTYPCPSDASLIFLPTALLNSQKHYFSKLSCTL